MDGRIVELTDVRSVYLTHGRMNGQTDERTDGRTGGRADNWTDGRTDGWTDGLSDGRMNGWMDEREDESLALEQAKNGAERSIRRQMAPRDSMCAVRPLATKDGATRCMAARQ